jgi:hypothetical protein
MLQMKDLKLFLSSFVVILNLDGKTRLDAAYSVKIIDGSELRTSKLIIIELAQFEQLPKVMETMKILNNHKVHVIIWEQYRPRFMDYMDNERQNSRVYYHEDRTIPREIEKDYQYDIMNLVDYHALQLRNIKSWNNPVGISLPIICVPCNMQIYFSSYRTHWSLLQRGQVELFIERSFYRYEIGKISCPNLRKLILHQLSQPELRLLIDPITQKTVKQLIIRHGIARYELLDGDDKVARQDMKLRLINTWCSHIPTTIESLPYSLRNHKYESLQYGNVGFFHRLTGVHFNADTEIKKVRILWLILARMIRYKEQPYELVNCEFKNWDFVSLEFYGGFPSCHNVRVTSVDTLILTFMNIDELQLQKLKWILTSSHASSSFVVNTMRFINFVNFSKIWKLLKFR